MIGLLMNYKPMVEKAMNYNEIVNESIILISCYLMLTFTDWIDDVELKYALGFLAMYCLFIAIAINIGYIILVYTLHIRLRYRKYKHDRAWEKHYQMLA